MKSLKHTQWLRLVYQCYSQCQMYYAVTAEIKAVERLSNIVKYSTQHLYCVLAVLTETLASYQT